MTETRATKSSRVIIIYTLLLSIIIAILLAQNFYFLDRNNTTQATIDNLYTRKIDIVMSLSKVVRERSLLMVMMYLSSDPWKQDEIFGRFHKLRLVFLGFHNEMQELGFAENEKILFDKVNKIINKTEQIQNDIVERIQSGGDNKVHSDISEVDLPLEDILLGHFDALIGIIRSNAVNARQKAKKQYRDTLSILSGIAVLVCISVILLMRRSLKQVRKIELNLIDEAETMSWDATHDALTNVYNRRWLQHKFNLFQNSEESRSTKHSILYIDLDEFKPVNDNFGHVVGDDFLCGVTREFERCIRHNDTLARMGGDEFAILLENCNVKKAKEIAECLIKRVDRFSILIKEEKVSISGCSIGIHEFTSATTTFQNLITQADLACYEAKKKGKNQSHIFNSY
ncbi:MAG: GGDEF domain-containing protein [Gammaproteobacteria bacterium]|nr:GGDEF domain-containing protein [Gammaproteobacteria bacterium]